MKKVFIFLFVAAAFYTKANNDSTVVNGSAADTSAVKAYFEAFGLSIAECQNQALYFEVYKWLGTPYRYGGNTQSGLDCSGFSKKIYSAIFNETLVGGSGDIYSAAKPIHLDFAREGDLLFFKTRKGRISHVGIYLSNGKFAHATTKSGVIISDLSEAYYQRTFFGAAKLN